ncbi:GDCCVxC domain-containing (seleno)protein [Thalassospira alkalitolerans]|uniref:GDCCVxC domain-containing (seleno)protein n=1 Tax=Thalassospira alkalitolerans TaxID=1293890 RepID=UPI003AA8D96B
MKTNNPAKPIETVSILTCPQCGHQERETMPTDACQFFYDCKGCGAVLRPHPGDCCVFCSFGSVPCPPVQLHGKDPGGTCCG